LITAFGGQKVIQGLKVSNFSVYSEHKRDCNLQLNGPARFKAFSQWQGALAKRYIYLRTLSGPSQRL